jgi:hypothetical protein
LAIDGLDASYPSPTWRIWLKRSKKDIVGYARTDMLAGDPQYQTVLDILVPRGVMDLLLDACCSYLILGVWWLLVEWSVVIGTRKIEEKTMKVPHSPTQWHVGGCRSA